METLLTVGKQDQPSWLLLSLFLIVACYFRFDRLWSTRNIDLILLLLIVPSVLFLDASQRYGHLWLLASGAAILIRLFVDGLLKRRPRLPQNLNMAGLSFLLVVFSVFQVVDIYNPERALRLNDENTANLPPEDPSLESANSDVSQETQQATQITTASTTDPDHESPEKPQATGRPLVIQSLTAISQLSIVAALLAIGWQLFGDFSLGVSMGALYLLFPFTSFFAVGLEHVLPAALILGALLRFLNPFQSGAILGLACGTLFFPVFLLPLWVSYYGSQNAVRFITSALLTWIGVYATISVIPADWVQLPAFDPTMLSFTGEGETGIWEGIASVWRMPVFALFIVMVGVLCWWPPERTLESLIARSTAVMIGIQFWNVQGAGIFPLWYVPLFLVVVFRPSLSHLAPPNAGGIFWWPKQQSSGGSRRPSPAPTESEQMRIAFRHSQ